MSPVFPKLSDFIRLHSLFHFIQIVVLSSLIVFIAVTEILLKFMQISAIEACWWLWCWYSSELMTVTANIRSVCLLSFCMAAVCCKLSSCMRLGVDSNWKSPNYSFQQHYDFTSLLTGTLLLCCFVRKAVASTVLWKLSPIFVLIMMPACRLTVFLRQWVRWFGVFNSCTSL